MEFLKNKQDEVTFEAKLRRWESINSSSAWLEPGKELYTPVTNLLRAWGAPGIWNFEC